MLALELLRNSFERAIYTLALGRLSLAIPLWVGKNEEQLCAATTTDTFLRSTSPGPGNPQRKLLMATEMGDQPPIQWALRSLRVVVVVVNTLLTAALEKKLLNYQRLTL